VSTGPEGWVAWVDLAWIQQIGAERSGTTTRHVCFTASGLHAKEGTPGGGGGTRLGGMAPGDPSTMGDNPMLARQRDGWPPLPACVTLLVKMFGSCGHREEVELGGGTQEDGVLRALEAQLGSMRSALIQSPPEWHNFGNFFGDMFFKAGTAPGEPHPRGLSVPA
jgi:hypothetical protein